ncbi:CbtB-domain containing protein [Paracoccus sp. DMF-8]|uniref:CbtB domain-containing protein n=1 Tax=Paracoccus sp. DMF-8 TaxID=3019445 RepID=UPI0023E37ECE|nr:CbtB domain-containing protein [Paracoccus sp. DMF-8]MDF3607461.1 CbtB-domain containing protein [Paracoccus sp. DMF-8]
MNKTLSPALSGASTASGSLTGTIVLAALAGAILIFFTGMAQPEALHDAAHDVRHAAGYPCH